MKKHIAALLVSLACLPALGLASEGPALDKAPDRSTDLAGLQNGARLFVNYCLNCHSAGVMRYNRLQDIGLTEDQIRQNLLFTSDKVGDTMKTVLSVKDGKDWFGAAPPDLSVIARAKATVTNSGSDYLYTYLRTFYRDGSRPTGWNNLIFPNVGMPHVLWQLQGPRELTVTAIEPVKGAAGHAEWERVTTSYDVNGYATVKKEPLKDYHGHATVDTKFTPKDPARALEYDREVGDLVGFMAYMSEPVRNERRRIGVWVLLFLGVFFVISWRLNASYWKDVK